jgi:sulfate adenylyltransferase
MTLVAPHGGTLVDRIVSPDRVASLAAEAGTLPQLTLDARELADLELIATGAASPLTGFLGEADYRRVLAELRLASGVVWPVTFTLAIPDEQKEAVARARAAALLDGSGRLWGIVRISDVFQRDPIEESRAIYGTDDANHPGVAYTLSRPRWVAGGEVEVLPLPELPFAEHRLTPRQLRARIAELGWTKVAGFQTRNPIHRAHEHLTKLALEVSDGIVIHPLVGETKNDDVPAAVRFRAYQALLAQYYPPQRTLLAAFPAAMRYAGPREALLHALLRKNYGITSLIVGRDHAGVGSYYPPLAAQEIFDKFSFDELGVAPLKFEPTFFCKVCDNLASSRTCAHDKSTRVDLSGSKVREILRSGGHLPREFTRPEVAEILRAHYLADVQAAVPVVGPAAVKSGPPGFILWFTGLSGAGKSTLANALAQRLSGERTLEILDGDEVRTHLSKGLGFSKADRDTNIHRIGFVARTLARHGVGVVTAAISPYAETRREVREAAEKLGVTFVEVFARAELDALVRRDVKGLYKKAIAGEVQHFTGVSDPYEAPESPDVLVRTDTETVEESLAKIVTALQARGLITGGPPLAHAGGSNGARAVPNQAAP